jgi:hypothetical protein
MSKEMAKQQFKKEEVAVVELAEEWKFKDTNDKEDNMEDQIYLHMDLYEGNMQQSMLHGKERQPIDKMKKVI